MTAADDLYTALGNGVAHAELRQHHIDAHRAEVQREVRDEQGPEDHETLAEAAQMYRRLRERIEATMTDPGQWDGDEDEGTILGNYVEWLASERGAGREDGGQPPAGESTPPGPAGPFERVTVILTPASSTALTRATALTGDTRTDTINRAIQTYALMTGEVDGGSRVLIEHAEPAQPGPVGCHRCGDTAGPWDPETGLCETCLAGGAR